LPPDATTGFHARDHHSQASEAPMPMFEVSTVDGYAIAIESTEAKPEVLMAAAKDRGLLAVTEVISEIGREADKHEIVIAYHAIVAIRPKVPR